MQDLRTNTSTLSKETFERYETLKDLINKKVITKPEAALINYIYAIRKVLSEPGEYSTKEYTVQPREIQSFELGLIQSFEGRMVNRVALEECKVFHERIFEDFSYRGAKKDTDYGGFGSLSQEAQEILSRVFQMNTRRLS